MRDKRYYGFASREDYEAYYSGPLPKWETDAMAAYVRETEQERAMSEHREGPSQVKQRPPAPASLDDRLRTVDLRSVIQHAITRCHDRGEGFDIMALEAAQAVRDALREKEPVRAVTGTGQVKGK